MSGVTALGKTPTESHICVIAAVLVQNEDDDKNRSSNWNRPDFVGRRRTGCAAASHAHTSSCQSVRALRRTLPRCRVRLRRQRRPQPRERKPSWLPSSRVPRSRASICWPTTGHSSAYIAWQMRLCLRRRPGKAPGCLLRRLDHDGWPLAKSFPGKPYINRGISGQTTPQMLVRFRPGRDLISSRARS